MSHGDPTTSNDTTPDEGPYPLPPDDLIDTLGRKLRHRTPKQPRAGEWPDWTPAFVRARPESLGSSKTWWLRMRSGLRPPQRLELHVEREHLLHQLHDLDEEMRATAERRLDLLAELGRNRDRLWPRVPWCRGRRPPCPNGSPIPPAADGAVVVGGGCLRLACLQILDRHGELPLTEIHAWLHRSGYIVAGPHPVKALADALGHEHDAGRAVRVARGVYALRDQARPPDGGPLAPRAHGDPSTTIDPLTDPPRRGGAPASPTGGPEPGHPTGEPTADATVRSPSVRVGPGHRGGTARDLPPRQVPPASDAWWLEVPGDEPEGPFSVVRVDELDDLDDPDDPGPDDREGDGEGPPGAGQGRGESVDPDAPGVGGTEPERPIPRRDASES